MEDTKSRQTAFRRSANGGARVPKDRGGKRALRPASGSPRRRHDHRRRRDGRSSLSGDRDCRGVPPARSGTPRPVHRHGAGAGKEGLGRTGIPPPDAECRGPSGAGAGPDSRLPPQDPGRPARLLPDSPRVSTRRRRRRGRIRLGTGGPRRPADGFEDGHCRAECLSGTDQPDPRPFRPPDLRDLPGIVGWVPRRP